MSSSSFHGVTAVGYLQVGKVPLPFQGAVPAHCQLARQYFGTPRPGWVVVSPPTTLVPGPCISLNWPTTLWKEPHVKGIHSMPARTCTSTGTEQNCQIRLPRYRDVGIALASSKLSAVRCLPTILVEFSYRDNLCAGHLQNMITGHDR